MKKTLAAIAALAIFATAAIPAEAQNRRHRHRGGGETTIIQGGGGGIDTTTLLALGLMGGGSGTGMSAILPLLLAQPQATTVIESRGGRRGRR